MFQIKLREKVLERESANFREKVLKKGILEREREREEEIKTIFREWIRSSKSFLERERR